MTNWKKYFDEIKEYWIVDENDSTKNSQLEKIKELYQSFDHEEELLAMHKMLFPKTKVGLVFDGTATVRDNDKIWVLERDSKRDVIGEGEDKIDHHLIVGDNYKALNNLLLTHKNKINIIYIDPPYNTGGSNLGYRDKFGRNAWLNFMKERLILAKELLSDDGVIFISIDDNEQAYLKVLMDEIMGEDNFLANIVRQQSAGSKNDSEFIANNIDYILVYCKNKNLIKLNKKEIKNTNKYNKKDEISEYKLRKLQMQGGDDTLQKRPKMGYSILFNKNENTIETVFDYDLVNGYIGLQNYEEHIQVFRPELRGSQPGRWRWGVEKFNEECEKNNIYLDFEKNIAYQKERKQDNLYVPYNNLFTDFINSQGTTDINKLFSDKVFSFAKPVNLIKELLNILKIQSTTPIVLDFFSGSGTTAQAVMELNQSDGCRRQFIGVQLNEKRDGKQTLEDGTKIISVDQITIERIRRVIQGTDSNNEELSKVDCQPNNNLIVHKIKEIPISLNNNTLVDILQLNKGINIDSYKSLNKDTTKVDFTNLYKLNKKI